MSSDGDLLIFQNSLNDNLTESKTVLFADKKWNYITDTSNGNFSSGQITFDLSTLSSMSEYTNLSEGLIQIPYKDTIKILVAAAGGTPTLSESNLQSIISKNGSHHRIDSCQLVLNGQTIQSGQIYQNVATQFKILTEWSQDYLNKNASTHEFAIDDCTAGDSTTITTTKGLQNATYATIATAIRGLDVVNNQALLENTGISKRASLNNSSIAGTVPMQILGSSNMVSSGMTNIGILGAPSNTVNTYLFSRFGVAIIKVSDLIEASELPLLKNMKGFLYLGCNNSQINLSSTNAAPGLATVSITQRNGQTCPILLNTDATTGLKIAGPAEAGTALTIQVVSEVTASSDNAVGNSAPILSSARLLLPFYSANPRADQSLNQTSKFFTSMEKIVNVINVNSNGSINYTMTSGVANARKLLLLPLLQNMGSASMLNPEQSCFDTSPGTSSPFANLTNLQVYHGNKPLFQNPLQYTFDTFCEELAYSGINDNMIAQSASGLLNKQLFDQNHRFYYFDLSRRQESDDGMSKSVQIQFTNNTTLPMKVIGIILYEKNWNVNTSTCTISSG